VKLFISYSREDAGNFAKHIHRFMRNKGHDVFIDVNDIRIGKPWADSIEKNISECDIFVVILTPDSLTSSYVEKEVLQAQKENKIIFPCLHEYVNYNEIKWDLNKIQGIEFSNEYQLVLNLYQRIKNHEDIKKPIDDISEDINALHEKGRSLYADSKFQNAIEIFDKVLKIDPNYTDALFDKGRALYKQGKYEEAIEWFDKALRVKPNYVQVLDRKGNALQKLGKYQEAIDCYDKALKIDPKYGSAQIDKNSALERLSEEQYVFSSSDRDTNGNFQVISKDIDDYAKTDPTIPSKSDVDILQEDKDMLQPSEDKEQIKNSKDVTQHPIKKDSNNKQTQGIFRSYTKNVEETKTNAPTTTIKSDTKEIQQKKDTIQPSNVNTGAIGGSGGVSSPTKYSAAEPYNNERKYTERGSSRQSQGINLKLIIIPIIAVAIIGVIVGVSYLNTSPSTTETKPPPTLEPEVISHAGITNGYQLINSWGSKGTGDGQFNYPLDLAVDSSRDNVYVADVDNYRIQKFDSNGNFITKWGSEGNGTGEFNSLSGIAIDSSGNVYVADNLNHRIQKFDSNGNFITKWGSEGTDEKLYDLGGISLESSTDYVYVSDSGNNHIKVFAPATK
jgi:tetratricopeptide (TPR) repeat protein